MNEILLNTTLAFPGGALGLLFKIAIACVIFWGIKALLDWAGVAIPRPVWILVICLVCIVLIYWLFELVGTIL